MRRVVGLALIAFLLGSACHRNAPPTTVTPNLSQGPIVQPDEGETSSGSTPPTDQIDPLVSPAPYASAMPIPTPNGQFYETYIVQPGDTLGGISYAFDVAIDELVELNNLENEAAIIHVGQSLNVPLNISRTGPQTTLLADSEVVLSPAYLGFDPDQFVDQQGGYLGNFTAPVNGVHTSGVEILKRVARQNSVGYRVLLALMEHYGGWVTQAQPTSYQPFGPSNPYYQESFSLQVGWMANRLNEGYYGYKENGQFPVRFSDGTRAMVPAGLNAGSAAVWNVLARNCEWDTWEAEAEALLQTYRRLFGDPSALAFEPVVPDNLTQPELQLPWETDQVFYYTGGPHAAYLSESAWAAVDFAPPDIIGNCFYSSKNITAAAYGRLIVAEDGEIYLDLDADGNLETGWVLFYLHMALNDEAAHGDLVVAGTAIGYASCEGGFATSSHLHFARLYNGEWMPADGPVPLVLSGWQFKAGIGQYDGTASRNGVTKTACDCSDDSLNALTAD